MQQGSPGRFANHLAVFVVGLVVAVGTFVGSLMLSGDVGGGEVTKVRALVPTSSALGKGSRVTMAGAKVGRVADVSRQGYATLLELDITDERVLPVPADSRVTLRQRTPVGENYVELTPGSSSRALGEDDVLPVGQADEYVDVDQLLSVLQGPGRTGARQLVRGLGRAVEGRGDGLNRTLGEASQVVQHGGSVFGLLSEDRRQLARLVDRLGRVTAAVGERGAAVRVTADRGLAALRAVGARDAALARTLDELPATLGQVQRTSGTLRAAATTATPVVRRLADTVDDLRPAVQALRPAAQQGRNAVRELGRVSGPLQGTLERVQRLSSPLSGALPQLRRTVCELAPMVRYTEPYTKDVIAAVTGLGSASNSYDAIGHLIRLTPIVGENSLAGLPDSVTKAAYTLLRSGLLGRQMGLTWNPYPKPGMVGKDGATPDGPRISGPEALAKSGYVFPRIHADC